MNAQTRFLPAMGGATAATFGIFFMMQGLAQTDMPDYVEPSLRPFPEVFFNPPPPPPPRPMDRIQPPEFVAPPVEDKRQIKPISMEPDIITIGLPSIPHEAPVDPLGALGLSDGHMIPIARVTPTYPSGAASRGIEGWVQLSFTVTRYGTVEDAIVIAAEPKGVFDRSALNAISKFRYKPTVINGAAQDTPNVQIKLTYSLEG